MTPVPVLRYADVPVHSPGWHEVRRGGIGSADAAAVAGLDSWCSPFAKWAEKTADSWPASDNAAMTWGRRLEAAVAEHFAEAHPEYEVVAPDEMYAHADRPWMRASPDRLLYSGDVLWCLLEIKTSRLDHAWEDGPPDYVLVQVQHQLAVMGLPYAYVAVLLHGRDYREYRVERDETLIGYLYAIEERFWDRVQTGNPPPVDGHDATTRALRDLFVAEPDLEVELPPEAEDLLLRIRRAKETRKDAESREAGLENQLKLMLGNASAGVIDGRTVCTWRRVTSHRVDMTALRAAHPDLAAEFTEESTYRKLTILKEPK